MNVTEVQPVSQTENISTANSNRCADDSFNKELKKGTIIISHGFPVKEYEKKLIKQVDRIPFPTYYYKI